MMDFTVLAFEGALASGVTITLDLLGVAAQLADKAGATAPRWQLCSAHGGLVRLHNGVLVQTLPLTLDEQTSRSVWVLPGLIPDWPDQLPARLKQADAQHLQQALTGHLAQGGRVAATCSAVFLLQAAGLLRAKRATTAWWLGPLLQKLEPACQVAVDRMVCVDGAITTAGAALAQQDMMLHLLREHSSPRLAELVSRVMLIDGREAQSPFMVPEVWATGSDLVRRLTDKVAAALPGVLSVADLARELCLSERSLSRHIRQATGQTTVALVQAVRLRHARRLLETSRLTVEQVALAVGYQDATALRKAMRRRTGANPSRFRGAVAPARGVSVRNR